MAYSDFTLGSVSRAFGLTLLDRDDLYATVPDVPISSFLRQTLDENVPLALAIHTEKARSELIVMPILLEVRRVLVQQISLFSGIDFTVSPEQSLNGVCDFIVSGSPEQLVLTTPVLVLVEAKKDDIKSGLGQCIAEMIAAQIYNAREGRGDVPIHGVVTTGSIWKFLRLDGTTATVDRPEYYLDNVEKIIAILTTILRYEGSFTQTA